MFNVLNHATSNQSFIFGNALRFDGVNDYVSLINSVPDVTQQTISWWSRKSSESLGYWWATSDASGPNREGLAFDTRSGVNDGRIYYFDGAAANILYFVPTPTNWSHYQVVRAETTLTLWVNGVQQYSGTLANMSDKEIAKFGNLGNNYLAADMQEIAIWQNVLGDATSAQLGYNSGNGNLATEMGLGIPNRYYRCNGTSGDSVLIDEGSDLVNGNLLNFNTSVCWITR